MEIEILAHGNTSPEKVLLLQKTAKFYAKYLNITGFKYKVYICMAPKLRQRDRNNGICSKTGDKEISIAVDSALALPQLLMTLAHEMVHAKQYVRGQYRGELSRNGKMKRIWLGKQYTVAYLNRPWEKEAFRREGELACALIDTLTQKAKKSKRVG
jgi:hypothetical protein